MFIIHNNIKNRWIQSILKSTQYTLWCICFFLLMDIINSNPRGEGRGKWGNLPNFLLEVELQVISNIPAISTLVWLLWDDNGFLMCNYSIIYDMEGHNV